MSIVFCQGTYGERIDQTLEGLQRIMPYVDRGVVIVDETVTEEQQEKLKEAGAEVHFHPWEDSMPVMRNRYLEKLDVGDWCIVSDPDEWFGEEFCKDLRALIARAEEKRANLVLINSHDILVKEDGSVKEDVSNFFKNLIFRYGAGVTYRGVGDEPRVHETLDIPNAVQMTLPRKYFYEHHKEEWEVWERAARNVYIGGGGNNVGFELNSYARYFKEMMQRRGFTKWSEVRAYLRKTVDPEVKEFVLMVKDLAGADYINETREVFLWLRHLHPEEFEGIESEPKPPKKGTRDEVMTYVETQYLEVLGRHADTPGKQQYTELIVSGQLEREKLPQVMKESPEYKQKFGMEGVKAQIPMHVTIGADAETLVNILMKSDDYWRKVKPWIDLGRFVLEKVDGDFLKWFYEKRGELTLEELLERLREEGSDI